MERLIRILAVLATVLGGLYVGFAVLWFGVAGSWPPLLIALAIVVAGPVEDLLDRLATRWPAQSGSAEQAQRLVDQVTSLLLVILLAVAGYLAA